MDWSYRPERNIEFGFRYGVGRASNFDTTTADLNDQSVRCIYSLSGRGQLRGEFTREEASVARSGAVLPFELTNGRPNGKLWRWQANLDYQVTQFLQATLSYDGRSEASGTSVHTGKAEVRAFF